MTSEDRNLPGLLRRIGIASWSFLGLLLLLGAVGWILLQLRILLAPLVLAAVLIYILDPVVTRLHRHHVPRILGTVLSYLVLVGVLVVLGILLVPQISQQASDLTRDLPTIYDDVASVAADTLSAIGVENVDIPTYDEVRDFLTDPQNTEEFVSEALVQLGAVTLGILEALLVFFLAPVIAFYVLLDLPKLREQGRELIPERHRDEIHHIMRQLTHAVGGFMRGQLVVAFIVGILTSIGFRLIGLPFWLVIGLIAGALNIIPFVGPWVGGALGVTVGLVLVDPATALWAAVVAFAVQQIDNNFISPTVLRATVRLHPATIILALLAGGAIAGFWGLLLAVPVVASVKIVVGHLWRTRVLGQSWAEAREALIVDPDTGKTFMAHIRRMSDDEEEPIEERGDDALGEELEPVGARANEEIPGQPVAGAD